MNLNIKIRLFILFLLTLNLLAEKDEITVPAKVSVDPYVHMFLTSRAYQINDQGKATGHVQNLEAGSLFFGSKFEQLRGQKINTYNFSFNYITSTIVQVVNNSKPFKVVISLVSVSDEKNVIELRTKDDLCAFYLKTSAVSVTKKREGLKFENNWTSFPDNENVILYDSYGEVLSDSFEISFALINVSQQAKATKYGGRIIWTLSTSI